jgi:hypothetical protein
MIAGTVARRHPVIICDEHQDSSGDQHAVVMALHTGGARLRVFADPMQRIFDRAPRRAVLPCDWDGLKRHADACDELDTPHRWADGCADLGRWTLSARRTLRDGGALDPRTARRPPSVEVVVAENRAERNLAYQLERADRRPVDAFVQRYASLLVLTHFNPTALSLRGFFNRSIPLWEGYTRYALDKLVDAIADAGDDCEFLASAIVDFMGQVGKGFSPSAFGNAFVQDVSERCRRNRRGKGAKLQQLSRLLLAEPGHRGVSAVLRRLSEFMDGDDDFAAVEVDCRREFREAVRLGEFSTAEHGLAEITYRRTYARPKPPDKAISIIHKAKGLESEAAVVMPCDRRTFPDTAEARCLLYVAISRAKRRLMLVVSRRNPSPLLSIGCGSFATADLLA